jgi:hypothetical protein
MVRQQGGMCAVCCANPAVHVDRDHATGRVRGILCFVCNRGLGKASDSIEVLKANDRLPPGALPMKYVLFSESGPDLGPRAAAPNRPRKA